MCSTGWRCTVMLGHSSTRRVTSALKVSRSTASAPPAATRATSAACSSWLPMRRISSFSRPDAESSRSAFRLLEQISSAKPSLLCAGEKCIGFCSYRSTCTPLPASHRRRFAARQTGAQNSYFIIAHVVVFSFNPSSAPASQSHSPLWRNRAWSPCGRGWSRTFRTWWPPACPRS